MTLWGNRIGSYPTFEGNSGDSFDFDVNLKWLGSKARTFDLALIDVPPKWEASIVAGAYEREIPAIGLEPEMNYPEKITVKFAPFPGELPDPGDYVITLEASSGDIQLVPGIQVHDMWQLLTIQAGVVLPTGWMPNGLSSKFWRLNSLTRRLAVQAQDIVNTRPVEEIIAYLRT